MDSIKKEATFNYVKRTGIKYVSSYFILTIAKAEPDLGSYIIGLKVSKKCGSAVKRNFIKRRYRALLREFIQANEDKFYLNKYYVFVGRDKSYEAKYQDLKEEFNKAMKFFKRNLNDQQKPND
jgi:ribonuclease P protein component